jgi:hypothetical protein
LWNIIIFAGIDNQLSCCTLDPSWKTAESEITIPATLDLAVEDVAVEEEEGGGSGAVGAVAVGWRGEIISLSRCENWWHNHALEPAAAAAAGAAAARTTAAKMPTVFLDASILPCR